MKRRVVLLGPPGAGKGTVAASLEARFSLEHVSSGEWLRKEIASGTELGRKVESNLARGELVPDEIVVGLLEHWLTPEVLAKGFLCDGFPRTLRQGEELERFCEEQNAPLDVVLYLDCPVGVILERITNRRVCPNCGRTYHLRFMPPKHGGVCDDCGSGLVQRADDTEPIVRQRLGFYEELTRPLVEYYRKRGKLVALNAALGSEAATAEAAEVLAR